MKFGLDVKSLRCFTSYRKETAPSPPLSPLLQASESVERNNNINNNMANLPPTVKNGQADGEIRRKVSQKFSCKSISFLLKCVFCCFF